MLRRILSSLLMLVLLCACVHAEALLDSWDTVSRIPGIENLYLVCKDGKWGLADSENNVILAPAYDAVGSCTNDSIAVCLNEKWGLVSPAGEILLEPKLRNEPVFSGDCAVASIESETYWQEISGEIEYLPLYGVINRRGETLIPFAYDEIEITPDGALLRVEKDGRSGYLNLQGDVVIELKYMSITLFEGNYAVATLACETDSADTASFDHMTSDGIINRRGDTVVPFEYDTLFLEENGLVRARRGENWGCLNLQGKPVIPMKYAALDAFNGGFAAAAIRIDLPPGVNDSLDYTLAWGVIDEAGKIILPFDYNWITLEEDGRAIANMDGTEIQLRIHPDGTVETAP